MQTVDEALDKLQRSAFRRKFHLSPKDREYVRGHPIFIAQHACACCCRGCLEKWYRVPKGRELSADEQRRIVNLLMRWIEREMSSEKSP